MSCEDTAKEGHQSCLTVSPKSESNKTSFMPNGVAKEGHQSCLTVSPKKDINHNGVAKEGHQS